MSCRDISTLVNTILQVYMSTQGVFKSIYNGKESILTIAEARDFSTKAIQSDVIDPICVLC